MMGPACGTEPPAEEEEADVGEDPIRPPRPSTSKWTLSTIADGHVGAHLRMDVSPQGDVGVAFFAIEHEVGELCEEFELDDKPTKLHWTLHYAQLDAGAWQAETVAAPNFSGPPSGLDFKYSPHGVPVIASMAGDPVWRGTFGYCGVNDAALYYREGHENWRIETAVSESNEAATGHGPSDFGYVVGYWPALAFDSAGDPGLAYKDVHSGGLQRDDFGRADLEFARRSGGSWSTVAVDYGGGAGNFNRLIFDQGDVPIIAYYKPTESHLEERLGVWVTRLGDDGETWEQVHLFARGAPEGPDLLVHPDTGDLHVVFYNSRMGNPTLATLGDRAGFESISAWDLEDIGDPAFDEGYTPSIAVSPTGELALAYYRCARASDGLGDCKDVNDGLIFAWKDGAEWKREIVDAGGEGECGRRPALRFDGAGRAIIAYRCENLVDGQVDAHVKFARRESLR
ncbi:MAG: hypothetical protein ACNA8W_02435 [Bradymonadaceae bacterium]